LSGFDEFDDGMRVAICELNENFFWSSVPRTDC
jgi:hypothetical protein